MNAVEVTTTCASVEEAASITDDLLAARLVACGQWWPISSRYRWNGEVHDDTEVMLVLKTRDDRAAEVRERLVTLHSYETPVVSVCACGETDPAVARWLADCCD